MSDVKEFEGVKYKLVDSVKAGYCKGCAFDDGRDCKAVAIIGDCGNQIYKQVEDKIKPIDEHEWSDSQIFDPVVDCGGVFCFDVENGNGYGIATQLNKIDIEVIASALGYDMVKRQSGGVEG